MGMASAVSGAAPTPPKRLFTWVDVDEHLVVLASAGRWPDWLTAADCWWDGLELTTSRVVADQEILDWLNTSFGPRSAEVREGAVHLRLDDPRSADFVGLPVAARIDELDAPPARRVPALREKAITAQLSKPLDRPTAGFSGEVQLIAFHSFKGGVGRTVHAAATADTLARRGHHVLLVDADLEAPGITWMYRSQGGQFDFCYEDLLTLLHATENGDSSSVVEIGAAYLPNQQVGRYPDSGRISVLPTGRRRTLGPPRIEPADLLTAPRSPYFLTESIAALAAGIGADIAIVDLRAGASELSAPVLLDPRVQRIFVTSLSDQSLVGTKTLIEQLLHRSPTVLGEDPPSTVIVTQYRPDVHSALVDTVCNDLAELLAGTIDTPSEGDSEESVDRGVLSHPVLSPFREELLALPSTWDGVIKVLESCRISSALDFLSSTLPSPRSAPPTATGNDVDPSVLRRRLQETAQSLIYAEKRAMASASGFLVTDPLSRLLSDHRTEPPVVLVVGAKGAGKTFLYAKACAARTWRNFAAESGIGDVHLDASIVPVLESDNLIPGAIATQDLRDEFAARLGHESSATTRDIKDHLRRALNTLGTDELAWRTVWLESLAMAAGVRPKGGDPEQLLTELANRANVVFVIDGLEDLLQSMGSEVNQTALRVLLVDVVGWLRALRGRPLGLVVFVRQDLVSRAVRQNSGQLLSRYESYALRWDKEEALRLALWVTQHADALRGTDIVSEIGDLSYDELVSALIPVWGWKMGTEKSKEARSHLWVPAALGDFNDQVQARDVVVFLSEAAKESVSYQGWEDRLLVPSAMRKALLECSTLKIEAIGQENQEVGDLLSKMQRQNQGVTVPLSREEIGLSFEEASFLVESGVFARDKEGRYWVAEIYRHGLGFGSARRARVLWR